MIHQVCGRALAYIWLEVGAKHSWGCNSGYSFTFVILVSYKNSLQIVIMNIYPVFLYIFLCFCSYIQIGEIFYIYITSLLVIQSKVLTFFSFLLFFFPFLFPSSLLSLSPSFLPPSLFFLVMSCYPFVPASMFKYSLLFSRNWSFWQLCENHQHRQMCTFVLSVSHSISKFSISCPAALS